MSVEAFQAKLMELVVELVERKLVGIDGSVVSGGGGDGLLMVMEIVESVVLPAESRAVAVMVWVLLDRVVVFRE